MGAEEFDRDYFERGIEAGVSCYTNYRWIPELTVPMAMTYIDFLGLKKTDKILDFGCAKGYVVRALRMLHRQTWGCDISSYALETSDLEVRSYVRLSGNGCGSVPFNLHFDWIIAKDVFEHIEENDLPIILGELRKRSERMFAVIPLGQNGKFIIPAYHLDKTHRLAKSGAWWIGCFTENGWKKVKLQFSVPGIKDNWSSYYRGNGFFILE